MACQMGWDLISASKLVPTVTCEVYGHTTGVFPHGVKSDVPEEAKAGCYGGEQFISVVELWKPGVSRYAYHQNISKTDFRGNEDGWPMKVIYDDVKRRVQPNERIVMVFVSDGAPFYREGNGKAYGHVRSVAQAIRREGNVVLSVSVDGGFQRATQDIMYSPENVIEFDSDINVLSRNIARVVGKALN